MYISFVLTFVIITCLMAFVYFYLFTRGQERFLQFCGFAWLAYSFSLFFLIFFNNGGQEYLLVLRKLADMLNILFLLFGVYSFMHVAIPSYWYRFSLYLLLWVALSILYHINLLSFYIPITLYQIIITVALCSNIVRYWQISLVEKTLAMLVFLMWGIGKSCLSVLEVYYSVLPNFFQAELISSNLLNFFIFAIYIQKSQQKTQLAEQLYKVVAENAMDAIFYYKIRPYKIFEYVTPSILTLTGYKPLAFYSNPRLYIELVGQEFFDEIGDIFNGKINHDGGHIFEMTKKNGENFWGQINATVIADKHGQPIAVEGILRDITKMKSIELEQITAKQSRDVLLSYISHELKTPVTSIVGYLTALKEDILSKNHDISEALDIVTDKALFLKELINDLEQLSQLETNQFSFDFMCYSARELSESLIQGSLLDIKSAGFQPSVQVDMGKLENYSVIADENRINQVFSNLIFNAIKYSKQGTEIRICFDISMDATYFMASIEDKGKGIHAEQLPHIFDRFYRGKQEGETSNGRGLGLTISKNIVAAHGGTITAESVYGQGSIFRFTIPLFKEVS